MTYPYQPPPGPAACYRHPDRGTYIGCTRCGRPACPECLRSAPVGQQCVDCVQAAAYASAGPVAAPGSGRRVGIPVVTYGLIAANVVVFVMQLANPRIISQLALFPGAVAVNGDYYRLFTSVFTHQQILHIGFNMWALYVLGPPLEKHWGPWRFTALYGVSALGGSVVVYLLSNPLSPTIGASGAVYGLFGAMLLAARRLNLDTRWLIGLIVINLVMTFTIPGISWQGHIGGLITGLAVGAAFVYLPRVASQVAVCVGLTALFAALIAVRTPDVVDSTLRVLNRQ